MEAERLLPSVKARHSMNTNKYGPSFWNVSASLPLISGNFAVRQWPHRTVPPPYYWSGSMEWSANKGESTERSHPMTRKWKPRDWAWVSVVEVCNLGTNTKWLTRIAHLLRTQQSLNRSRNSSHFIQPKGTLASQKPAIGSYPEPDESNPHSHIPFLLDPFNIILTSTPRSSKYTEVTLH
jgi:hypothetical protein